MGDLFLCKLEDNTNTRVCSGNQPGGGVIEMRLDQASSITQ